jgi:peptidyl-prolyl cis-trans isomerase C
MPLRSTSTFVSPNRKCCIVLLLLALGSCTKHTGQATQTVARVGGTELTVNQLNDELSRQPQVAGSDPQTISRLVLEKLINQQVLYNKAMEKELDRDPAVLQAIERAKRMILAGAYLDRYVPKPAEPTDAQVSDYFSAHPELFAHRKEYDLLQVAFPASALTADLKSELEHAKIREDVISTLNEHKIEFQQQEITRSAEDLPLDLLAHIYTFQRGQVYVTQGPAQADLIELLASTEQPLSEQQAVPMIRRFIENKNRQEAVDAEVKRLRAATTIEYMGEFAKDKHAVNAPSVSDNGQAAAAPGTGTAPPQGAASLPNQDSIERGVSGLGN